MTGNIDHYIIISYHQIIVSVDDYLECYLEYISFYFYTPSITLGIFIGVIFVIHYPSRKDGINPILEIQVMKRTG